MFRTASFTVVKIWKQPVSINRRMDKKTYGTYKYIQWNTTQTLKRNEILPLEATWIDLEGVMLSELSWMEKDNCYMISFISGI